MLTSQRPSHRYSLATSRKTIITHSTPEDSIYKYKTSLFRNPKQMIKVASCQRLNISRSKTSCLWNPTQMIKVSSFHQLMPQNFHIVTAEGLDGVAEDEILKITQSTSEDSIYKSEMSCLRKPTHIIKVGSCQKLILLTWQVFTTESLNPSQ